MALAIEVFPKKLYGSMFWHDHEQDTRISPDLDNLWREYCAEVKASGRSLKGFKAYLCWGYGSIIHVYVEDLYKLANQVARLAQARGITCDLYTLGTRRGRRGCYGAIKPARRYVGDLVPTPTEDGPTVPLEEAAQGLKYYPIQLGL